MSTSDNEVIQIADQKLAVSKRTAKLVYVSVADPKTVSFGSTISVTFNIFGKKLDVKELSPDEPSTIFIQMLVVEPNDVEEVPRPSYFPTYAGLTPNQKWIYLNWLKDISQPVNVGYVFIYYYGLERRLLTGEMYHAASPRLLLTNQNETQSSEYCASTVADQDSIFDIAFEEIRCLQQHHTNASFQSYSNSALLHSSIFRGRRDRIEELHQSAENRMIENTDLLICHRLGLGLSAENLMALPKKITGFDKKSLKNDEAIFETVLTECLTEKYGSAYLPLASRYKITDLPKQRNVLFANISFPDTIRTPQIPSFFDHAPFVEDVKRTFAEAIAVRKANKTLLRKS